MLNRTTNKDKVVLLKKIKTIEFELEVNYIFTYKFETKKKSQEKREEHEAESNNNMVPYIIIYSSN
jgi:hypothetical protein